MTEDEMVGWYHRLNGQEFEQSQKEGRGAEAMASQATVVPGGLGDSG